VNSPEIGMTQREGWFSQQVEEFELGRARRATDTTEHGPGGAGWQRAEHSSVRATGRQREGANLRGNGESRDNDEELREMG
jgi:hypothetical protein